jgi:hypothetical protein
MTWLAWLGLAVAVTAIVAVASVQPKGTRPVAHTQMMGMARLALGVLVVILVYFVFRARVAG